VRRRLLQASVVAVLLPALVSPSVAHARPTTPLRDAVVRQAFGLAVVEGFADLWPTTTDAAVRVRACRWTGPHSGSCRYSIVLSDRHGGVLYNEEGHATIRRGRVELAAEVPPLDYGLTFPSHPEKLP
jgi:hypothetical protein